MIVSLSAGVLCHTSEMDKLLAHPTGTWHQLTNSVVFGGTLLMLLMGMPYAASAQQAVLL